MAHDQPETSNVWLDAKAWFHGKPVLVVGGTTGIGAAISERFLSLGAQVTATGVTKVEVERGSALPSLTGAALRVLDISEPVSIAALLGEMTSLHCLVNCAGATTENEHDAADFSRVVDVNLNGAMMLNSTARPLLAAGGGSIVMIASVLAYFGSGKYPAYAATKGAVVQLTRSLAIAYAGDGIRVNAIAPGYIRTAMTDGLRQNETRNAEILKRTPAGRWGEPSEVADGAVYLCSPAASFVSGTTLFIDGGFSAV